MHGENTGKFGLWLCEHLEKHRNFSIFYDHGIKQDNPNVVAIKGFYGDRVNNKNRLADIDVMVVNNDKEIDFLIEIEESKMSPKKLLGDIFSILICNKVAVKIENEQKYFSITSRTRLIVAGVLPNLGEGQNKFKNIIKPRLRQFNAPIDTIQTDKIKFVLEDDISKTIQELTSEMKKLLP